MARSSDVEILRLVLNGTGIQPMSITESSTPMFSTIASEHFAHPLHMPSSREPSVKHLSVKRDLVELE